VVHAGDPADPADATVEVTARTANGPVYGAACDWSTEPAVSVAWQAVAAFDQPARSTTHFRLEADGRFTARCVVGNITTSVSLHR
jgi:hypothetical protein